MKFSLDTVGYGGYFTNNEHIPLEDAMRRAAVFGYDAVCIYAHRPIGFPMDIDQDRRQRLKDLAAELDDGRLVFQAVNIEEEPNEHFIDDYKLFTKSVVLVDERSGEQAAWKNLPRVWELLGDKEAFIRYIQGETREYLSGKKS